jgi:competence protein ComEA
MEQKTATGRGLTVLLSTALGIAVGGATVYVSLRSLRAPAPIVISTPAPTATAAPSPTLAPLRVYVSGAVCNPAVYQMARGSIIQDAVEAAGGASADADLDGINLAQELQDQQHIRVPRVGEVDAPPAVSGGASRSGESVLLLVDINTASAEELESLPGIGEVMARRIVDYREANGPFRTVDQIQDVSGIGPKTFGGLKDLITVGP